MIGVDEVGRGAWAGPLLVVAARLKPHKHLPKELADSKQLSKAKREALFEALAESCEFGEGWVAPEIIDEKGLTHALKSACMLAVFELNAKPDEEIILDGSVNFLSETQYQNVHTLVKADSKEPLVSAASIYAKVLRDRYMTEYTEEFPEYDFENNVGYGTAMHATAINRHGVTPLHRRSFKPIREAITS